MRTSECWPTFTPRRVLRYLRPRAWTLGSGIVGGMLMPIDDISRSSAQVAVQILDGVAPAMYQSSATAANSAGT